VVYLDTSALVKLVLPEPETDKLLELIFGHTPVSSIVARVELRRAVQRVGAHPHLTTRADAVLAELDVVPLSLDIAERGGRLPGPQLRALDAIHLASALTLEQIGGFVAYDRRLAKAAAEQGLNVLAPQ
jgi:predicted nucleic acid-binding protein